MDQPRFCPHAACPSHGADGPRFTWHHNGQYARKCDGHTVQRYRCGVCRRGFSRQTFRANYRWRKPTLHYPLIGLLASKVTRRQAARLLGVDRKTIERRFVRLSRILRDFHAARLHEATLRGGIDGIFQLDEAETFETNRRLKPVTMAVMIERHSYFVLDVRTAPLPARKPLREADKPLLARYEAAEGKRRSGSRQIVRECMERMHQVVSPGLEIELQTDRKGTYRSEARRACRELRRVRHKTTSSRAKRDYRNLIFPVNHTLAMMRDGMSCLVRRSWAHAKKRAGIQRHAHVWLAWRNYVRGITAATRTTPAMEIGLVPEPLRAVDLARWRWPLLELRARLRRRAA